LPFWLKPLWLKAALARGSRSGWRPAGGGRPPVGPAGGRSPWEGPGTAPQLAPITYTGSRTEVLLCCGNKPYNHAIEWFYRELVRPPAAGAEAAGGAAGGASGGAAAAAGGELRFVWPEDLYGASKTCRRRMTRPAPSTGPPPAGAPRDAADAKRSVTMQCGYAYSDLADHPLAVVVPYSVHSYGLVQAAASGDVIRRRELSGSVQLPALLQD